MESEVIFILADTQAVRLIRSKGFQTKVLDSSWNDLETELPKFLDYIEQEQVKVLLVDFYYVTEKYLASLQRVTHVVYIDDLNNIRYPVDILISYVNYWKKMNYEKNYPTTQLLLGCAYVPLRKEFQNLPPKNIRKNIENLLILTGGSDNYDISEHVLEHLDLNKYKKVDVICGRYYEKFDYLQDKYKPCTNVKLHQAVDNIIDYMIDADVVISAGGTTLYELCATGTPTITYSCADNQLDNVGQFAEDGIMQYAGDIRTDDVYDIMIQILEKYNDKISRRRLSLQETGLIDGNGAGRIIGNLYI